MVRMWKNQSLTFSHGALYIVIHNHDSGFLEIRGEGSSGAHGA